MDIQWAVEKHVFNMYIMGTRWEEHTIPDRNHLFVNPSYKLRVAHNLQVERRHKFEIWNDMRQGYSYEFLGAETY